MKKLTLSFLAAFALGGTSFAGPMAIYSPVVEPCYKDQEFTFDVFYSYSDACHQGDQVTTRRYDETNLAGNRINVTSDQSIPQYFRDGSGGGVGLSYYFCRYFGLGLEGNWWVGANAGSNVEVTRVNTVTGIRTVVRTPEQVSHDAAQQFTSNIILRLPVEGLVCWAPYLFGGGGGVWDGRGTGFGDAGLGAEVRITPDCALFSDWRWEFMADRNDVDAFRAGFRFIF